MYLDIGYGCVHVRIREKGPEQVKLGTGICPFYTENMGIDTTRMGSDHWNWEKSLGM